jgi:four helix bundle protein
MLAFQRLDVYQRAIQLVAFAAELRADPCVQLILAEELVRAAVAIPLNIAHASARRSRAEEVEHYAVARRSAMVCGAVLDALAAIGHLDPAAWDRGALLTEQIVAMLT